MSESKFTKLYNLNGVTGRMGMNQHLLRSIVPIIQQGGVLTRDGVRILPDPVLVGRNPEKLAALAEVGVKNWSSDLDSILADERYSVYFDAQTTDAELMLFAKLLLQENIYIVKNLPQRIQQLQLA